MEISYVYTKPRRDFGRHVEYTYTGSKLLIDIQPNPSLDEMWIERTMCSKSVQTTEPMSEHEVNTQRVAIVDTGMQHLEGGWPKEIDPTDTEHLTRFRKKVERDAEFNAAVRVAGTRALHACMTNNALDITEQYFQDESSISAFGSATPASLKITVVFRDPNDIKRTARHIAWGPTIGSRPPKKLAVSYATMEFQHEQRVAETLGLSTEAQISASSYIWDLENPSAPTFELSHVSPITCLRFSTKDSHLLVGGLYNGLVGSWDTRVGSSPVDCSPPEIAHTDPVYDIRWVKSKTGTECASVSTDGTVIWWDTRKMSEPLFRVDLKMRSDLSGGGSLKGGKISRPGTPNPDGSIGNGAQGSAETYVQVGGTCLNYDASVGLTKFLVGTETGHILNCNSRPKDETETVQTVYLGHHSAVRALERSPYYPRYFMSVGDWCIKLWNDDSPYPLRVSSYAGSLLTGGGWSPTRPGVFATSRYDGYVDVWDYFYNPLQPTVSMKISDSPLSCCAYEGTGKLLASGTLDGTVLICEMSENLHLIQPGEKQSVQMLFDRELKREKNLEFRSKEEKLKSKSGTTQNGATDPSAPESAAAVHERVKSEIDQDMIAEVEEAFFSAIAEHMWELE